MDYEKNTKISFYETPCIHAAEALAASSMHAVANMRLQRFTVVTNTARCVAFIFMFTITVPGDVTRYAKPSDKIANYATRNVRISAEIWVHVFTDAWDSKLI